MKMSKKYQVNIAFADYETVVEAESEDEAVDIAWDEMAISTGRELTIDRAYIADCVEVQDKDKVTPSYDVVLTEDQQDRLEMLEGKLGVFLSEVEELTANELAEYEHLVELKNKGEI